MTDELRDLLTRAADGEEHRFLAEHPGDETLLFERAIAPRRLARRGLEAGSALLVVGAVAASALALRPSESGFDPAQTTVPTPTASHTSAPAPASPVDVRLTMSRGVTANGLVGQFGLDAGAVSACAQLDRLAGLGEASAFGGEPLDPAGRLERDEFAIELRARTFANSGYASAYRTLIEDAANTCDAQLEASGSDVDLLVSDVALTALSGDGLRIDATSGAEPSVPWRLWVHASGAEVAAVVAEPGAADAASGLVVDWFTLRGE